MVGGGTSGAPAGIAASKSGAKTLVIEYLHELGGVGTAGLIGSYWYGPTERLYPVRRQPRQPGKQKLECRRKSRMASPGTSAQRGGHLVRCFRLRRVDAWRAGLRSRRSNSAGAAARSWRQPVIDATGNADIAACAGAQTQYGISELGSLNVQIAGYPERPMRKSYVNTCYTMVDDTDVWDVWHLMAWRRTTKPSQSFDVGQLVDSRERRRIVGDYVLTVEDILTGPHVSSIRSVSTICNFDAAAFPDARVLLISNAKGPCFRTDLPYRCLLPKRVEGILVVGLGASAQRDAMTLIRMQADLQNQGYAAGMAAAAAARLDGHTRGVDVKSLQKKLVAEDVLDERVVTDEGLLPP